MGATITYILRRLYGSSIFRDSGFTWLVTALFALTLSAATIVTDALTYEAYWHQSGPTTLAFLSLLLLGVAIGGWLPASSSPVVLVALPLAPVFLALVTSASVLDMTVGISERLVEWQMGPAPIEGVLFDRESENIATCWMQLQEIRGRGASSFSNQVSTIFQ